MTIYQLIAFIIADILIFAIGAVIIVLQIKIIIEGRTDKNG